MNHLEMLVRQFYEWQGYIVRGNVKVGRLTHGGWEGELDVVTYHPVTKHLVHLEPSLDANTWEKREERFEKKFKLGRKYIRREVFPWLDKEAELEQIAILTSSGRDAVAGCKVESVDGFMARVKSRVKDEGRMGKNAIPEEYGLLRTIQLTICGYSAKAHGDTMNDAAVPGSGSLDAAKPAPDSASDVQLPRGKRDNSRYIFEGERYKKGPLVRVIVAAHVDRNPAMTYSKLCEDFPKELQGSYGVVGKREDVLTNPRWQDPDRRFFVDNPLTLADGVTVVVCSQWGDSGTIRNFPKFLMAAKKLGYTVAKVGDDTDA